MDGNRRWATQQGLMSLQGHRKGFDAIQTVIDFSLAKGIEHLSLYTFSTENLKRSADELYYLFEILAYEAVERLVELKKQNINITFIGDHALFPKNIKPLCDKVERETRNCNGLYLHMLLCYGGKQEIVDTARRIAIKMQKGDLQEADITTDLFERFLWTANIPHPDLIIRTGGDHRLSNFLLFQAAYSELYFMDCLWPDISHADLEKAAIYFDSCRKNIGQ